MSSFHCIVHELGIWIHVTSLVCFLLISGMLIGRYNVLDKMVKSGGMQCVINKMLIDQLIFVPVCQILFYSGNSILEVNLSFRLYNNV